MKVYSFAPFASEKSTSCVEEGAIALIWNDMRLISMVFLLSFEVFNIRCQSSTVEDYGPAECEKVGLSEPEMLLIRSSIKAILRSFHGLKH